MLTLVVSIASIAPRPERLPTLIVPQPSKVLPLWMVMVLAPIEPEAMTATRWPLEIASTPAWIAAR